MKSLKELFIRNIPIKNYIITFVVSSLIIIISIYARLFYLNYRDNMKKISVFQDESIKQINTEDIKFALNEMSDAILYVSYTGNSEIYNNEKKILREIKKNNLTEKIIYWNVSDLLEDNKYLEILKETYPSIKDEITAAPLFIYVNGGEPIEAMSSELKIVDVNVFNKLIEIYDIE